MKKVKLRYMVVPEELKNKAYVKDAVKVRIINVEALVCMGYLGESGKKLADAEIPFYFEELDARKLIDLGLAEEL